MNELDNLRAKSRQFTKIIILEFAYCSLLYFVFKVFLPQSGWIRLLYLILLILPPFIYNIACYMKNKRNSDGYLANNAVMIQVLVVIFILRFLLN